MRRGLEWRVGRAWLWCAVLMLCVSAACSVGAASKDGDGEDSAAVAEAQAHETGRDVLHTTRAITARDEAVEVARPARVEPEPAMTPKPAVPITEPAAPTAETSAPAKPGNDNAQNNIVDVYVLAGQSNMDGWALQDNAPPGMTDPFEGAWIYWPGRGRPSLLQPSSFDRKRFGPEMSMGRALKRARPESRVALVKYAVGGSDLYAKWYPGMRKHDPRASRLYRRLMRAVSDADAQLRAEGYEPRVRGVVWMQGENDAVKAGMSMLYERNLERFVKRVREDLDAPNLPFVIGKIYCPRLAGQKRVCAAQEAVHAKLPHTGLVDTQDLTLNDYVHFDAMGILNLGDRFARALIELEEGEDGVVP